MIKIYYIVNFCGLDTEKTLLSQELNTMCTHSHTHTLTHEHTSTHTST